MTFIHSVTQFRFCFETLFVSDFALLIIDAENRVELEREENDNDHLIELRGQDAPIQRTEFLKDNAEQQE